MQNQVNGLCVSVPVINKKLQEEDLIRYSEVTFYWDST